MESAESIISMFATMLVFPPGHQGRRLGKISLTIPSLGSAFDKTWQPRFSLLGFLFTFLLSPKPNVCPRAEADIRACG